MIEGVKMQIITSLAIIDDDLKSGWIERMVAYNRE